MASPAVAGIAALIMSQYPKLTAAQVKQIILDSYGGDTQSARYLAQYIHDNNISNNLNGILTYNMTYLKGFEYLENIRFGLRYKLYVALKKTFLNQILSMSGKI